MDALYDDDDGNVDTFDEGNDNLYEGEIEQGDAWWVINKYFDSKGLVSQQIDSFNEFMQVTLQEMVDDSGEIVATSENQYRSNTYTSEVFLSISSIFFIFFYSYLSNYYNFSLINNPDFCFCR